MTTEVTLTDLCKNVTLSIDGYAKKSWWKLDEWQRKANSYRCTLCYQGRRYSFDFWQGKGITHKPTAEGCLDCLLSDAALGERSFEEFCSDLGYDAKSRKARDLWRQCVEVSEELRRLLGDDYETFLYADPD